MYLCNMYQLAEMLQVPVLDCYVSQTYFDATQVMVFR